jgi:hypothetical protein
MHITETVRIAAEAWRKVKPAEDPDFNNCALSHRETLICKVERVAATGGVYDDFEKAAKEILDSQLKAPEPAATTESAPVTTQDATPATEKKTRRSKKSK